MSKNTFVKAPAQGGGPSGSGGSESLEDARVIGDTFTGGDVYWDEDLGAVFGKSSGDTDEDYLRVYSDKANHLQVFDSTKDGAGTIRAMSWQMGGSEKMGLSTAGRLSLPSNGIDYSGSILPTVGVEGTTQIGTASQRVGWVSTALGYFVYANAADANAVARFEQGVYFGAGGASDFDLLMRRSAAKTFTFDDNHSGKCTVFIRGTFNVGDASTSLSFDPTGQILTLGTAGTGQATLLMDARGSDPAPVAGQLAIYAKTTSGVPQLWVMNGNDSTPYQISPPAGGGSGGWTDDGTTVRLTTATDKVIVGDTVIMGGLEAAFTNQWRFTTSVTGASGGHLLFLVDNPSTGVAARTVLHSSNNQGCGAALMSNGSNNVTADGMVAGDAGLIYMTVQDIDPPAGAGLFINSGILSLKWYTYPTAGGTLEPMRLTRDGQFRIGDVAQGLINDEVFRVGGNSNGQLRAYVRNRSTGNNAWSLFGALNDNSTGPVLFSASTGLTTYGGLNAGDGGIYFDGEGADAPQAGASLVFASGLTSGHSRPIRWIMGGSEVGRFSATGILCLGRTTPETASVNIMSSQWNHNLYTQMQISNETAGTGALVEIALTTSGPNYAEFGKTSASFTSEAILPAGCTFIRHSDAVGGIVLATSTNTGMLVKTNGNNIRYQIDGDGKQGWFGHATAAQQVSGANLTNNVTSGGTDDVIADFTSLTVYASDAAAIRNDIYQLARKLKQVNDALRLYGLLT